MGNISRLGFILLRTKDPQDKQFLGTNMEKETTKLNMLYLACTSCQIPAISNPSYRLFLS